MNRDERSQSMTTQTSPGPRTFRLCRSSDTSKVVHVEHSGGLTFCGKESGWYSGLQYVTEAEARRSVTCKRCRKSLAARQS